MACRHLLFLSLVVSALLVWVSPASAQATKRLILKDGSYQIVTKWEIQGNRVHYYSAERSEWEDVPNSMVDWNATNQFEKDRLAGKMSPEAQALDKEIEQGHEEHEEEEAESPHVAPGLRLPSEGGVYALDTYLAEPELVPLDQSTGEVNRQVKRNVLRAVINPVAGSKTLIELSGPRAKIQLHASLPTIYVNLTPVDEDNLPSTDSSAELPWDRFCIVRADVKADKRIVGVIKTAIYGKSNPEEYIVPATSQQLGEEWVKITPKVPLPPGEYALAEMLSKEGMNSYVWDFGVHSDAPANLSVIRPEKENEKTATPVQPGLKTREQ
jgi:hypothetical protein